MGIQVRKNTLSYQRPNYFYFFSTASGKQLFLGEDPGPGDCQ